MSKYIKQVYKKDLNKFGLYYKYNPNGIYY